MNIGYEEDELKPFEEATPDLTDQKRIGIKNFSTFYSTFLI